MSDKTNILIVDDHELIHIAIENILKANENFLIIGHAYNGNEALKIALEEKPHVVLMDINMPELNGIEASKKILSILPDTKIIILTQHSEGEYVSKLIQAGTHGYLLKNSSIEEVMAAIETVLSGKLYLNNELSHQLITNTLIPEKNETEEAPHLTSRETEILKHIAAGKSNQEIAEELNISVRTIETHRRNLMQKLKATTVVELLRVAVKHKIIDL